jgi:regulator of RNase E activity RraB
MMKIPDDADGDAMRRVLRSGSDPSKPIDIDFMVACLSVAAAEKIAPVASALGYSVSISMDKEDHSITCNCSKNMLLDYDLLIQSQEELYRAAKVYDGYVDGWGTFGNVAG